MLNAAPLENAVSEAVNESPEAEMIWGEDFGDLHALQVRLNEYVLRHDNERPLSTLNYMGPVELRLTGMSL